MSFFSTVVVRSERVTPQSIALHYEKVAADVIVRSLRMMRSLTGKWRCPLLDKVKDGKAELSA